MFLWLGFFFNLGFNSQFESILLLDQYQLPKGRAGTKNVDASRQENVRRGEQVQFA